MMAKHDRPDLDDGQTYWLQLDTLRRPVTGSVSYGDSSDADRGEALSMTAGILEPRVTDLEFGMAGVSGSLTRVVELLEGISEAIGRLTPISAEENVIVLRSLEEEVAQREILDLLESEGPLFYSEISKRLRLDLQDVVRICNKLEEKDQIRGALEDDGDSHE